MMYELGHVFVAHGRMVSLTLLSISISLSLNICIEKDFHKFKKKGGRGN